MLTLLIPVIHDTNVVTWWVTTTLTFPI